MSGILQTLIASIGGAITDTYFNLVTLLLPGNGTNGAQNNTFLDSSSNNFTITRNGNTTQGTFSPFSQTGWSGNFNTSTTYLTVTDTANLRFGSSNFTIEAWVYRAASGAIQTIASKGASTPTGWVFQISAADKLVFTDTSTSITGATTLNANTWYYVAVVRAGTGTNQTTLYVNAASDATGTSSTNFNQTNNMLIGADRSTANFANGYISNLRLSNTNRTISSTPTSALTADANTIFLALNSNWFQYTDSTAAYTAMAVTGTPSVQAFSPFAPTAEYSAATVGGSGYFDGTGDWLNCGSQSAYAFGTGTFTIEAWVYPTSRAAELNIAGTRSSLGSVNGWSFAIATGGGIVFFTNNFVFNNVGNVPLNAWTHVAITREGTGTNQTKVYINGVSTATATNSENFSNTALGVGGNNDGSQFPYFGYIASFRMLKGTALTSFDLTAPLTNITNTSLLLNYTNAGITDATAKNVLETVGNAQISTTQSKFGGSSMSFDGTGDYLFIPQSNNPLNLNWEFLKGDFTIEFWFRANSVSPTNQGMFVKFNGNASLRTDLQLGIFLQGSNLACNAYQSTTNNDITFSSAISINTWYHVAFVRSGTSVYAYLDGARNATIRTITGDLNSGTTWPLQIGRYTEASVNYDFNGYIDDLRVTKFARYSGATITVPSAAFPLQ